MREALAVAQKMGMSELWVSTEQDNGPAKALYQKLDPSDAQDSMTYSFVLK